MRKLLLSSFAVLAASVPAVAADKPFWLTSAISAVPTIVDTIQTSQIRGNYQAWQRSLEPPSHGRVICADREHCFSPAPTVVMPPCAFEASEPFFYGAHPGAAQAWTVGIAKIGISTGLGYVLRKKHSRAWWLPQAIVGIDSSAGVRTNVVHHCL